MKEEATALLHKILKDNSLRITDARSLVFDLLWGNEPQTMNQLEKRAQGAIDRASIYRAISLYEKLGLVQRIIVGWKYKLELSDVFTKHHHHISCLGCGRVIAIQEDKAIEKLIDSFANKYDITAERHQFEIQGYCKTCQSTEKQNR
jgi:Fur family ferric uptake transcriptional regulator